MCDKFRNVRRRGARAGGYAQLFVFAAIAPLRGWNTAVADLPGAPVARFDHAASFEPALPAAGALPVLNRHSDRSE